MRRSELENKVAVLLGGRAAEALVFGEYSTGAADDLAKATDIARSMAARYGMDEALGQATYAEDLPRFLEGAQVLTPPPRALSEETMQGIDRAVRDVIGTAFDRATEILKRHRTDLDETAAILLEKETLHEDDLAPLAKKLRARREKEQELARGAG